MLYIHAIYILRILDFMFMLDVYVLLAQLFYWVRQTVDPILKRNSKPGAQYWRKRVA